MSLAKENQVGNTPTVGSVPMSIVFEYMPGSSKNTQENNTDFCHLGALWHARHGEGLG